MCLSYKPCTPRGLPSVLRLPHLISMSDSAFPPDFNPHSPVRRYTSSQHCPLLSAGPREADLSSRASLLSSPCLASNPVATSVRSPSPATHPDGSSKLPVLSIHRSWQPTPSSLSRVASACRPRSAAYGTDLPSSWSHTESLTVRAVTLGELNSTPPSPLF